MTTLSLAQLIVQETKAGIYEFALGVANRIGLPVSTWETGNPTRSMFHVESEYLEKLEEIVVGFIKAGFLDLAAEIAEDMLSRGLANAYTWLEWNAKQFYNVDVPPATAATTRVVLTNTGGGFFPDIDPGDIIFKNTTSGKTYKNTSGGTLASGPGTTLTLDVEAEEVGSESSAGAGEIDEIVTGMIGVTCTNPVAAIGQDKWSPSTIVKQCRDKIGSQSSQAPRDIYTYVARNKDLTGTNAITRARAYSVSNSGDIAIYLAGPGGAIAEVDRALVETAIMKHAVCLTATPHVYSASNVVIPITYEVWIYSSVNKTAEEIEAAILSALQALFRSRDIGGDIIPPATSGVLAHSVIKTTIGNVFKAQTIKTEVSTPSVDTPIANGEVAAIGLVSATIHFVTVGNA